MQSHLTQIKCPDSNSEINLINALKMFFVIIFHNTKHNCPDCFHLMFGLYFFFSSKIKYFVLSELT